MDRVKPMMSSLLTPRQHDLADVRAAFHQRMLYNFYFDDQGILRLTQKTPDPLHDPDRRNLF